MDWGKHVAIQEKVKGTPTVPVRRGEGVLFVLPRRSRGKIEGLGTTTGKGGPRKGKKGEGQKLVSSKRPTVGKKGSGRAKNRNLFPPPVGNRAPG